MVNPQLMLDAADVTGLAQMSLEVDIQGSIIAD